MSPRYIVTEDDGCLGDLIGVGLVLALIAGVVWAVVAGVAWLVAAAVSWVDRNAVAILCVAAAAVVVAVSIPALAWYENYRTKKERDEAERQEARRQREIENLARLTGLSPEKAEWMLRRGAEGRTPPKPPPVPEAERQRPSPDGSRPAWLDPPKPPPDLR